MQPVPFDAPGPNGERSPEYLGAEIGRRTALAAAAFEQRIWRDVLQRWDDEFKPASIAASPYCSTSVGDGLSSAAWFSKPCATGSRKSSVSAVLSAPSKSFVVAWYSA